MARARRSTRTPHTSPTRLTLRCRTGCSTPCARLAGICTGIWWRTSTQATCRFSLTESPTYAAFYWFFWVYGQILSPYQRSLKIKTCEAVRHLCQLFVRTVFLFCFILCFIHCPTITYQILFTRPFDSALALICLNIVVVPSIVSILIDLYLFICSIKFRDILALSRVV